MRVLLVVSQMNFCEPMGAMQLAAVLKEAGHTVEMAVIREDDVRARAREFAPDLVAVSCMSPEVALCLETSRELKKDGHAILMGGPHPTFFPEVVAEPCVDAVCVGEGEGAILDVLDRMARGESLRGIPNILTSPLDRLELRPLVQDLDTLPYLERDLIYRYPAFRDYPLRSFFTGRGCIYNCTYCFNAGYKKLYKGKGAILRRRSPQRVIDEILQVRASYPMDFVRFSDDTFIYKLDEWALDFLARYKAEVGLPFYCLLRADMVTPEMADALREAGCHSISMSIESGVEHIRRTMLKRKVSNETIVNAVNILQDRGMLVQSACMFGLPGTTLDDDIETLDLVIRSKVFLPGFGMFMPYPGTELGQLCREKGYFKGDMQRCCSYQQESPLSCFTPEDKRARHNLMLLAPLVCKMPFLRNVVVDRLIHGPGRKVYYFLHWLTAGYLSKRMMCPKLNLRSFLRLLRTYILFYRNSLMKKDFGATEQKV